MGLMVERAAEVVMVAVVLLAMLMIEIGLGPSVVLAWLFQL